jgi:hypothetical protein
LKEKKITHEEYMRNVTLQGHSRQVAVNYYTIEDGRQSAYDIVTSSSSYDTTDEVSMTSLLTPAAAFERDTTDEVSMTSLLTPAATFEQDTTDEVSMTSLLTPAATFERDTTDEVLTPAAAFERDTTEEMSMTSSQAPAAAFERDTTDEVSMTSSLTETVGCTSHAATIEQAVSMVRSHAALMLPQSSPTKRSKFTLEGGVAGILARSNQISAMTPRRCLGIDHPGFDSDSKRIAASNTEKSWLFNYFLIASTNGDNGGNIYKDCLNAILINNIARGIFHERHVLSSDRLKTITLPVIKSVKEYENNNVVPEWLTLM